MLRAVYFVLFLWALFYLAHRFTLRRTHRDQPSLPLHHATPRHPSAHIVLRPFYLVVEITALNPMFDVFSVYLHNHPPFKAALRSFYNIGNVCGVLGMTAAVSLLVWTTVKLIVLQLSAQAAHAPRPYSKRGITVITSETADIPFHLIIPGITTPISHLPMLLFALFIGQTIHELGHAVAAAVESVPLSSAGASLFVIIPSAFVSLSSGTLQKLRPAARLRILSGGAFHNFLAWITLLFLGWIGVGSIIVSIGYQDASRLGRVVVSIDYDSPLRYHLPIGAVITKLNDYSLAGPDHPLKGDPWSKYFLDHDSIRESTVGWCVNEQWFLDQESSCCSMTSPKDHDHVGSCFVTSVNNTAGRCIDPVPLLTDISDTEKCTTTRTCNPRSVCIRPSEQEHLLRITLRFKGAEKVVLWSGPASEVWEQVEVGSLLPRTFLSPTWLPRISETYFMYMRTIMFSLYVMNLLPLPFLDGDKILSIAAKFLFKESIDGSQDLGSAERGSQPSTARSEGRVIRRRRLFKAGVQTITWIMIISLSLLTLLRWNQ